MEETTVHFSRLQARRGSRQGKQRGGKVSRRRCHSPSSSSLSSRRASFLSRRSCLSISALMRCDSFSSADRQQQPAMVRAATDGATRFGAPQSSARRVAEPTLDGHPVRREKMRADLSSVVRGLNLRNSIPPAGGLQGRGESRTWRKLRYTWDPGSRSPRSLGGGEGELLLGALPTPGDACPLAQEDRPREKVGERGRSGSCGWPRQA